MKRTLAALVAALALLAACGDDSADTSSTTEAAGRSESGGDAVAPERIVSMSASATEMLFAIGAGDTVVAADSFSNHPPEAPTTDLSAFEPNIEAIAGYDPDLVVVDASDADLVTGLETIGITVYDAPAAATLADSYDQIVALGELTGHVEEAEELVSQMQEDIDAILAEVPERDAPLTFFHELDELMYSVTSETFIGELYSLAGLENIADAADADNQSGGYPQLSAEYVIDADPDIIFLADAACCGQTAESVAARPGFADLKAVTEGNIVLLDEDIASRWGPRVVDYLRTIVDAVIAADGGEEAAAA